MSWCSIKGRVRDIESEVLLLYSLDQIKTLGMQLRTKKIIATEFLYSTFSLVISSLIVGGVWAYSMKISKEIEQRLVRVAENKEKLTELLGRRLIIRDSLQENKPQFDPNKPFTRVNDKKDVEPNQWSPPAEDMILDIVDDSGLNKEDSMIVALSEKLESENKMLQKINAGEREILENTSLQKVFSTALVISLLVLFPLRYFVYLVVWSYKIIRQKE